MQCGLKRVPGVEQPTRHGPFGNLEDLGDLRVAKTLQLLEHEDFAMLVSDALEPLPQELAGGAALAGTLRTVLRVRGTGF